MNIIMHIRQHDQWASAHLKDLQGGVKVGGSQRAGLLLELSRDHQRVVGDHVEFVKQARVCVSDRCATHSASLYCRKGFAGLPPLHR